MANYNSTHTGPQIDEAVAAALPNGRLDQAIQAAINTAVSRAVAQLAAKIHAEQHAAGGTDPITPAAINAMALDGSGTMTGNLVMSKAGSPQAKLVNETTNRILYLLNSESTKSSQLINQLDSNNYNILRLNPETDGLKDALKLERRVAGTTETHTLLHTGNLDALVGSTLAGLVMLKTLTVEEDDVEELEFQLTAEELNKYKRFVIFPKLESEWSSSSNGQDLYLEAPSFYGVPEVSLGKLNGLCSNGIAFISVGANYNTRGWSLRMMALNYGDPGVTSDYGTSDKSDQNPTTEPLTFRLYTETYSFIKGGTVSIMGVN